MRLIAVVAASLGLAAPGAVSAAPTLTDLVEIAELSSLSLSPDGRWAAVREDRASIGDNAHHLTWWVVDVTGARAPVRVGDAGGPLVTYGGTIESGKPQWSADSAWFYYRALANGAVQVWRARFDGAVVEQVTHDLADVVEFKLDPISQAVTYTTGEPREAIIAAELAEYDRGILVDGTIEPGQSIFRGMVINGRLATQRLNGRWFARWGLLDRAPLHERRQAADGQVEEIGRRPRPLGPEYPGPNDEHLSVTGPSGAVAFATGAYGDEAGVAVRHRAGAAPVRCVAAGCRLRRVYALTWLPGGDELLIHGGDFAREHVLVAWNPGTGKARRIAAYAGVMGSNNDGDPECEVSARVALCAMEGATEPARLEAIDLRTGRRTVVLDPNREARPRVAMAIERLSWNAGGYDFTGTLFLPQGRTRGGPGPLFIHYYNCTGYLRGGTGDEYPFALLAAQGIAALCINQSPAKGQTRETHDALLNYDIAVAGIRAVVDQLAARGLVDRKRVGMGGLSFGSEVTMRTAVTTDLLAALAISSPQFEPIYWWYGNLPGRDMAKQIRQSWRLGAPEETPERWKEVSTAANAHRINAPVLMQLPEQESRYNYELFGRIRDRKVPVEMVVFPEEPHIKYQPRHKAAVYERNLDWFRFWLAGEVDPHPRKAAQYERWRAMKAEWEKSRAPAD